MCVCVIYIIIIIIVNKKNNNNNQMVDTQKQNFIRLQVDKQIKRDRERQIEEPRDRMFWRRM
jgi:hypothetical protein